LWATDASGNTATSSGIVTVVDKIFPTLTVPGQQNLNLDDQCQAALPDYTSLATASDNCSVTISQIPAPGTIVSGSGIMQIQIRAIDPFWQWYCPKSEHQ
jgi:hypothetical protein